ncbi:MAG: hypothetical protein PUC23_04300, partial [bacterium]|nr:hypothetical protein [bacterium]
MTEENKFLKSLNELNKKIESSKTFLPNEILNYLKKVLNLDISVLNDSKFNEIFKDNYYFPIALYNLCERTKIIINRLCFDQDLIDYSYSNTCFSVDYKFSKTNLVVIYAHPECYKSCNINIVNDFNIDEIIDTLRHRYNFLYNLGEQSFKEKEEMVYTYQSILYILNNRKTIEDTNSAIINSL